MYSPPVIEPETQADAPAVEALVLAAFGPGRFAKTAERLRERAAIAAAFMARQDDRIVGSVRLWRIRIGDTPALFLGPIAVEGAHRGLGVGAALVDACLKAADLEGLGVLLVGDAPYFARFGFHSAVGPRLSGPVNADRLLWRGESSACGDVRPCAAP